MAAPTIVTERLRKEYGRFLALDDLDLTLEAGGILGFLGPNGAGKTTTIRLLLGLLRPTRGSARIFGRDAWRESGTIKEDVGYLPGDVRLEPAMSARRTLAIFAKIRRRDLVGHGLELAERFGLDTDLRASRMSRGTRQKLAIVLACAHRPSLLVLDEPTTSLDPFVTEAVHEYLRERARDGAAIFFSSHELAEVEALCERVVILRKGRSVADASVEALRAKAEREVKIRWESEIVAPNVDSIPSGLELRRREGREWRLRLRGPAAPVLRWLAGLPVEDLEIAPPTLETLFAGHYGETSAKR